MKGVEKKIEDLQPRYSGLALTFLTRSWIPGATPTRWTGNNEWQTDVCDDDKLTFAQEPEANELLLAQVDNLCGKHSALVTKWNDGRESLLSAYAESMTGKKQFTRDSGQKARVTRRW